MATTVDGTTGITTPNLTVSGNTTLSAALTYGSVTLSNAVTGTGSMVLSASPTLTGTLTAATANFGAVGSVVQVAVGMTNSLIRLRERNAVNQLGLTTNINDSGTQDDATKVSWELGMGGASDYFLLKRAAAGGSLAEVFRVSNVGALTIAGAITYGGVLLGASVTGSAGSSMVLSGSPTLTGTPAVSNTPTASWGLDFSGCTVTIANGGNAPLPTGSGQLLINETSANGAIAIYLCGGGSVVLVGTTNTAIWQASTSSPAAGYSSVAFNGTYYTIYNNQGGTRTFGIQMTKTRNAV